MPQNDNNQKRLTVGNALLMPEVVKMLESGHSVTIPLRGYSMRPFLEDRRDKAVLVSPGTLRVGDVVLAEIKPRLYVLHRIVGMAGDEITLKGDGNLSDEHCKLKDVMAKAAGFYRKGRHTADSTDGRKWRTYSWLWTRLFPIRRYLLFAYRHLLANRRQ